MKYLILKSQIHGNNIPIMFPEYLDHAIIAELFDMTTVESKGSVQIQHITLLSGEKGDELEIMAHDHFGQVGQKEMN
jgi:hypothetical protein